MSNRILVSADAILDEADSDEQVMCLRRGLRTLVDEVNCALPEYECTLMHLDTADYMAFTRRPDPDEGSYWADLEEEREQMREGGEPK